MKHDKLVRDRITEIIKSEGQTPITHMADEEEYWEKLKEKLKEEVDEFLREGKEEELADILEVIHAIYNFKGIDWEGLELLRKRKAEERGGFKNRTVLDEVG
jgi:predicted house-cleaning noncanonical NTP pyrophosphatase (MazG superfamily)